MLVRLPTFLLVALGLGLVAACGSKTFDSVESGGAAAKGGSDGGGDGGSGAGDPKGGSGGTTSGSAGKAGEGSGGTSRGGTSNGGTGAGGADVGGASGTGGSHAGAGGTGGTVAGAGGSMAGAGGTVAGAGGSIAGAGGCTGICPRIACAAPVTIGVTAPGGIAGLEGTLENDTTGATVGALQCYPSALQDSCYWSCQYYQTQIPDGDYTIVISAPGYVTKNVDFTVEQPTNCGCCGCVCGTAYHGTTELEPDGSGAPECCSTLNETSNCGSCGHACEGGQTCSNGECVTPCLGEGSGCDGAGATCCSGLTCCSGAQSAPRQCYSACPP
jgi:hypothetical protein